MPQLNENWRLDTLFPDEYSDFIAELYYQDNFVCLITQQNGMDQMEIEIESKPNGESWKFKLSEFEGALKSAKQKLWDLRDTE